MTESESAEVYEYVFGVPMPRTLSQEALARERLRHIDNIDEMFPELLAKARRRRPRRRYPIPVVVPAAARRVQAAYARQEAREARQAATIHRRAKQRRRNQRLRRVLGQPPRRRRFVARLVWRLTFAMLGGRA